jgi:hypothetical protein
MNSSELRGATLRLGYRLARTRGERICTTFADSFPGDLARFAVGRKLRKLFPSASPTQLELAIAEWLSP